MGTLARLMTLVTEPGMPLRLGHVARFSSHDGDTQDHPSRPTRADSGGDDADDNDASDDGSTGDDDAVTLVLGPDLDAGRVACSRMALVDHLLDHRVGVFAKKATDALTANDWPALQLAVEMATALLSEASRIMRCGEHGGEAELGDSEGEGKGEFDDADGVGSERGGGDKGNTAGVGSDGNGDGNTLRYSNTNGGSVAESRTGSSDGALCLVRRMVALRQTNMVGRCLRQHTASICANEEAIGKTDDDSRRRKLPLYALTSAARVVHQQGGVVRRDFLGHAVLEPMVLSDWWRYRPHFALGANDALALGRSSETTDPDNGALTHYATAHVERLLALPALRCGAGLRCESCMCAGHELCLCCA